MLQQLAPSLAACVVHQGCVAWGLLQGNTFTGLLPASYAWSSLVIYSMGYNNFTGTLPAQLYRLPFLSILDVRNNS
jgi:hypothetical protein